MAKMVIERKASAVSINDNNINNESVISVINQLNINSMAGG
jgi:hypothetical protein